MSLDVSSLFKPNIEKCSILEEKKGMLIENKSSYWKMRMFDIHMDVCSLGILFILWLIHIQLKIVLSCDIEPKQGKFINLQKKVL